MSATLHKPISAEKCLELAAMAFEMADNYARSDIECYCAHHSGDSESGWWYDTTKVDDFAEGFGDEIEKAIKYCDLRGFLRRMPGSPHIVGFPRTTI